MKNTPLPSPLEEEETALSVLIHLAGESARLKKQTLMTQHFFKIQTGIAKRSKSGPFVFHNEQPSKT